MQIKKSDWERLEDVIEWANLTPNAFAREIGLLRGENLYQIKRGNNKISRKLTDKIVTRYPEISSSWLMGDSSEIFASSETQAASIALYNIDIEREFGLLEHSKPSSYIAIPLSTEADFAMIYRGTAMGATTPTNTIVALKRVEPSTIIGGDEYLVVADKFTLLRTVRALPSREYSRFKLVAADKELYDDITIREEQINSCYKVVAKVIIM